MGKMRNVCGRAIKKLRTAKGWSQEALAIRCQLAGWDVDRKLLSKVETGFREITDAEIRIVVAVLRCKPDDLFDMTSKGLVQARSVIGEQPGSDD